MSSKPSRPQIPTDMKAFNEKLISEFRANRGELSGQLAGRKLMLLTTTGARSHEPRTVVIGFRPSSDRYVAIASNNGSDVPPHWFRNLMAEPIATVEVGADKVKVRARVATQHERNELAKLIDYLERQQALTSREIPIVVFEKV
ncbi:MAG TPA: nitroreductase/quinone reductase family protein [Candidatus Limnocylindrales bacterium]|nr:nitroreductase/quinone reductase family protein [Candidatus Limnocylindrales bacterium]